MRAGKLRHRVQVDEPTRTQDASGDEIIDFVPWSHETPADVQPLTGREKLASGGVLGSFDTRIIMRWSSDTARIDQTWRVRFSGIVYNIVSAEDLGFRHRTIEIMATSGLNAG